MAKQNSFIAVRITHLNGQKSVRTTARKDMSLKSEDGTKSVTIKAGETFYLIKSDSDDTLYYVLTGATHRKYGWQGYCPCYGNGCKHEYTAREANTIYHAKKKAQTVSASPPQVSAEHRREAVLAGAIKEFSMFR